MDSRVSGRQLLRAIIGFALYLLLTPALLFIAAGTLDWPWAWVSFALQLLAALGSRLIVWRISPDTLRERAKWTQARNTPGWDRILGPLIALAAPAVTAIVAGLDHRFGWASAVPAAGQVLAAAVIVASYALGTWAMVANRFFSAVARIQSDRGQVAVTDGPYAIVRHPAYAGAVAAALALPIMLDALTALIPALIIIAGVVIRTKLEDDLLHRELEGYAAYAARTKYRLVPGIW